MFFAGFRWRQRRQRRYGSQRKAFGGRQHRHLVVVFLYTVVVVVVVVVGTMALLTQTRAGVSALTVTSQLHFAAAASDAGSWAMGRPPGVHIVAADRSSSIRHRHAAAAAATAAAAAGMIASMGP